MYTDSLSQKVLQLKTHSEIAKDWSLQIYHARKLLNPVQEKVSLLDGGLIKSILSVRSVGFKNTCDFVNLAVQFTSCYKARQFPVEREQKFKILNKRREKSHEVISSIVSLGINMEMMKNIFAVYCGELPLSKPCCSYFEGLILFCYFSSLVSKHFPTPFYWLISTLYSSQLQVVRQLK